MRKMTFCESMALHAQGALVPGFVAAALPAASAGMERPSAPSGPGTLATLPLLITTVPIHFCS